MSYFFRYTRNGGIVDVVKDGQYWYKSVIYPERLAPALGEYPLPFPERRGSAWFDSRALRKSLEQSGWKLVKRNRDCTHMETGNRTTKRTV